MPVLCSRHSLAGERSIILEATVALWITSLNPCPQSMPDPPPPTGMGLCPSPTSEPVYYMISFPISHDCNELHLSYPFPDTAHHLKSTAKIANLNCQSRINFYYTYSGSIWVAKSFHISDRLPSHLSDTTS
jgi:hypothetical protein